MAEMIDIITACSTQDDFGEFCEMEAKCFFCDSDEEEGDATRQLVFKSKEKFDQMAEDGWINFLRFEYVRVGYVVVSCNSDDEIKIEEFYIKQLYRRRGLGRMFVKQLCDEIKEQGFKKITLFSATLLSDKFWSSCGFRSVNGSDIYEKLLV